jgi:hypothetical protein
MNNKFKVYKDLDEINRLSFEKLTLIAKLKYSKSRYNWKLISDKLFGLSLKIRKKK